MTLDEAFEKFDDRTMLRRASYGDRYRNVAPELLNEYLKAGAGTHPVSYLKMLRSWGDDGLRKFQFIIPGFRIDDLHADDWEVYE